MFYILYDFKKKLLKKLANRLFPFRLVSDVSELLRSLTKNKRCERIALVAHKKWATMSNLLRALRGNEGLWANRSGCSPKMSEWVNRSILGKKWLILSEIRWANSQPCWIFLRSQMSSYCTICFKVGIWSQSRHFSTIWNVVLVCLFFIFSFSFFFYFRSRNFLKIFFGKNKVFLSFGFFNNVFSFENIAPGQKAQTNLYKKINRKNDLVF